MKTKPFNITNLLQAASVAAFLGAIVPMASAQLYYYEGFAYTAGSDIIGQNGWSIQTGATTPSGQAFTAVAGSLSAPGVTTTGGSALLTGAFGTLQAMHSFANISGADGTTTWYSYIGQRLGDTGTTIAGNPYPRGVNIGLFDTEATANPARQERIGIGNSSNAAANEWSIIPEGAGGSRVGSGVPFSDLYWAVMRIDHHGDATVADDAYLFLNPDPNVEPATSSALAAAIGVFDYSNLDFIRPFVGNVASSGAVPFGVLAVDEIRIGGDYASMSSTTVAPEPTSITLLGLGGLAMLIRRKTNR